MDQWLPGIKGEGGNGGRKEVNVGALWLCGDIAPQHSTMQYYTVSYQWGNWEKGTWDISALFPRTAWKRKIISK